MRVDVKHRDNAATMVALMDGGIAVMRQNIKRGRPHATEEEIDAVLSAWLCRADDPMPGDTAGTVRVRILKARVASGDSINEDLAESVYATGTLV